MEQVQLTCMQEEKLESEELKVGVKYIPEVLDDYFEPKAVHDHFMELTKIYHPSGDEDRVREYIIDCAQKIDNVKICYYKPDAKDPGERVIILRREGSGNYASSPYITLQAHMDMVCSPDNSIFPLHVFGYYDDNNTKWIKAGDECSVTDPSLGTTLGADDGIGVATILALLEDTNLKDYPIECLFTVQEETDMGGAAGFDKNLLIGRRYINLDAEDAKTIIYGSAATQNVQFEGNVNLESVRTDFITLELSISGLLGGHSGVNINNGRLNAIKVITETLVRLNKRLTKLDSIVGKGITAYDLRLISMNSLTEQEIKDKPVVNKIPTWIKAKITIPRSEKDNFKSDFNAYIAALKVQFQPEENNLECNIEEISSVQNSLNEASTDALLCLLRQIPHGVIHMIPKNTDVVETSSNLAAINSFELNNDKIVIMVLNRSSDSNSLGELVQIQKNIGELFNYEVNVSNPSPIWQPKVESDLVGKAETAYKDIHGDDCNITVIHAGLECGYIANYFKDNIDCISIGPTIVNPHTGGERLNTETVKPFYDTVSDLIQRINNSQKIEEIKKTGAEPIEPNPNQSFTLFKKDYYNGQLFNGLIIPCSQEWNAPARKYSIIVNGREGMEGVIPGIKDIWVQDDVKYVYYRYSIHVLGGAPAGQIIHFEFTDEEGDTYSLMVSADHDHYVNFNSNKPAIKYIEWYFGN